MSKSGKDLNLKRLYQGTTKNVFKSVIIGKAVAGATLDVDFERETPDITSQLKVIMKTDDVASHPLSAHPRVPEEVRESVSRAILSLSERSSTAALLKRVHLSEPMHADYARDYQALEEIDVERLAAEGPR